MPAAAAKVAFISDLHLGCYNTMGEVKRPFRDGVVKILQYLQKQNITHLVMLGDVWDNWTFPMSVKPLSYRQMLEHPDYQDIIETLQRIDSGINLVYCVGNHDFDAKLDAGVFKEWFPNMRITDAFRLENVWGEHGHKNDLFNACPDPLNLDPAGGHRPLGYYITRIHSNKKTITSRSIQATPWEDDSSSSARLQSVLQEISSQESIMATRDIGTVATLVINHVMRDVGAKPTDTILMPDDSVITIQQVIDAYRHIFKDWQEKHGLKDAFKALLNSIEYMDPWAQKIRNDHAVRLVAFGHSHKAKWNPDTVNVLGKKNQPGAYVNDGALCKWPQTAVIVDYLPETYRVVRHGWDNQNIQRINYHVIRKSND